MRLAFVAPRRSGRRVIRLVRREGVAHYARFRGACTAAQRKRQNPPVQTACGMADLTRPSRPPPPPPPSPTPSAPGGAGPHKDVWEKTEKARPFFFCRGPKQRKTRRSLS